MSKIGSKTKVATNTAQETARLSYVKSGLGMGGAAFQEGPSLGGVGRVKSCYLVASVLGKPTETTENRG